MAFKDNLARAMSERGVGVRWLAAEVGVCEPAVRSWLRGSIPRSRNVDRICDALGCERDRLMDGAARSNLTSLSVKRELLRYVRGYIAENGWAPTYQEMADAMGGVPYSVAKRAALMLAADGELVVGRGPRAMRLPDA